MRKGERDATASLYLSDANGSFLGRCIQRVKGLRPGYDRRVMDVEIVVKGLAVKGEKPEMKRLDPLNKPVPMAMRSARQCTVRLQRWGCYACGNHQTHILQKTIPEWRFTRIFLNSSSGTLL